MGSRFSLGRSGKLEALDQATRSRFYLPLSLLPLPPGDVVQPKMAYDTTKG